MNWEIPQAKQKFSELVEAALTEPQPIYDHKQLMAFMVEANLFQDFLEWQQQKRNISTVHTTTSKDAEAPNKRRQRGSAKGKIWVSPDFDEPLADFQEYME